MAIYPLPEYGKPVRILNFFPGFMAYTNNMPLALAHELYYESERWDQTGATFPMAMPLNRDDIRMHFTFEQGRNKGEFWIRHVNSGQCLGISEGYYTAPEYDRGLGIVFAQYEQDNIDWFIDGHNYDMIAHIGRARENGKDDDSTMYFLEATPIWSSSLGDAVHVNSLKDGSAYVDVYMHPFSEGGSPNQRWTWEYV